MGTRISVTAFALPSVAVAREMPTWFQGNARVPYESSRARDSQCVVVMDPNKKPTARTCELCGKPKGVTRFLGHWLHIHCARSEKGRAIWGKR